MDPPATPSENEHGVDLGDILGGEWPELHAGSVATLLNADKKSSSVSSMNRKSLERNKSANIASHFSNSKPRYDNEHNVNVLKKSECLIYLFLRVKEDLHRTKSPSLVLFSVFFSPIVSAMSFSLFLDETQERKKNLSRENHFSFLFISFFWCLLSK